jgi:hypothetical protein
MRRSRHFIGAPMYFPAQGNKMLKNEWNLNYRCYLPEMGGL